MDFKTHLVHSWDLNNKITLYLLDNIKKEWLTIKLNERGRSIGEQFVHINNIRSFWIGKVGEKVNLKLEKKYSKDQGVLKETLNKSSQKMHETMFKILEKEIVKGYQPDSYAFFSQMIAHEAHHRGQIMAIVKGNDLPIDKSVNFGLWNWSNK